MNEDTVVGRRVPDAAALLLFSGFIQTVGSVPLVAVGLAPIRTSGSEDTLFPMLLLLLGVAGMLVGAIVIAGALQMRQHNNYGIYHTSIIFAMVPLGAGYLLGLPSGLWSLLLLKR